MRFTIRANIEPVISLALREDVDADLDDITPNLTVVRVNGNNAMIKRFVDAITGMGWRWYVGVPRASHADPTFARAADNIEFRQRRDRDE